ncbi:hypothetical protein ACA910_018617 [Epithemia clementina (nom. ined.)]
MGLVHTPRVIYTVAKGLLTSHGKPSHDKAKSIVGVGENIHSYVARAGFFDVDYLGHMNNAAYLSHAELARWELTAQNGMLGLMLPKGINFLVASTSVRFRREVRPLFRKFQIDSSLVAMDHRHVWMVHNFRYPIPGRNRVRAQVIVQGVVTQWNKKGVLDPREFFRDTCGFDSDLVESLNYPGVGNEAVSKMLDGFVSLDQSLRTVAAEDDKTHEGL